MTRLLRSAALLAPLLLPLGAMPPQTQPASAQAAVDVPTLAAGIPDGITLEPLAATVIQPPAAGYPGPSWFVWFERVPIGPASTVDGRDQAQGGVPDSPEGGVAVTSTHLLSVESGEMVLVTGGGEETYGAATAAVVPAGIPYQLRNDTDDCVSVLRVSAAVTGGFGAGTRASVAVPDLPLACGRAEKLVSSAGRLATEPRLRSEPVLVFLARITWRPGAYVQTPREASHPGPTGMMLESGVLNVQVPTAHQFDVDFEGRLDRGGTLTLGPHRPYSASNRGTDPAVALVVGAIPAGMPLWRLGQQHLGRAHRYRLPFDETWSATAESWSRNVEGDRGSFLLSNQTGELRFDDFPYNGGAGGCLDDAVAALRDDPGVRGVELQSDPDGVPIEGEDSTSAFAQYAYRRELADGTVAEFVGYLECREFASGEAVLLVTATVPLPELDAQVAPVQRLLNGLVLLE